jgi:hypothetical protein
MSASEARLPTWVIFNRGSGLCRAAHFRFAPKADVRVLIGNWVAMGQQPTLLGQTNRTLRGCVLNISNTVATGRCYHF